jgi:hypothetical protein
MVERAHARARARVCACVGAHVSVCVLCEWPCNAWPCVGVRPHSECCTLGKHPRACVCRSRAFPARPAHRPACIKTAGLADRWARMRVDTNDENRALRDISIHEPPATSKPVQTATLLSRGEAPEAEIDTRRRASPVALARTWHFGHHQCPLVIEFPTLEAAWGRAGRCGAGRLRAWSGGAEFGRSALICAEQSGGIACHSIRRPNPAEMCGRLPACRPGRGAGFKNFGIYLGQKTLVHPLCRVGVHYTCASTRNSLPPGIGLSRRWLEY